MTIRHDHCPECGVDAGKVCRNLDETEAVETCDGRPLLPLHDSVERTKAPRAPGTSPRTKARRRHSEGVPVMVACEHCASPVRLWGQGLVVGRAWCSTTECQLARRRRTDARMRENAPPPPRPACEMCGQPCPPVARRWCGDVCKQRARRVTQEITAVCFWCSASIALNGRGQKAHYPCCGERECKRARSRLHTQAARQRKTVTTLTT